VDNENDVATLASQYSKTAYNIYVLDKKGAEDIVQEDREFFPSEIKPC
jgi:hypothetical protein